MKSWRNIKAQPENLNYFYRIFLLCYCQKLSWSFDFHSLIALCIKTTLDRIRIKRSLYPKTSRKVLIIISSSYRFFTTHTFISTVSPHMEADQLHKFPNVKQGIHELVAVVNLFYIRIWITIVNRTGYFQPEIPETTSSRGSLWTSWHLSNVFLEVFLRRELFDIPLEGNPQSTSWNISHQSLLFLMTL